MEFNFEIIKQSYNVLKVDYRQDEGKTYFVYGYRNDEAEYVPSVFLNSGQCPSSMNFSINLAAGILLISFTPLGSLIQYWEPENKFPTRKGVWSSKIKPLKQ